MNTINCQTTRRNTPYKSFCDVNLSAFRKIIVCPVGHSFKPTATAKDEGAIEASKAEAWLKEIMLDSGFRVLPIKSAYNVKPENQEDTMADTQFEGKKFIKYGKEEFTLEIEANPYVHERLWTLNNTACSVYIIDANENILGWSSNGMKFQAFSVEMIHINKMTQSDGSTPRTTELKVVLSNPNEWNATPQVAIPEAGFTPSELEGIYDIELTQIPTTTNTATKIYVTTNIVGTGKGASGLTLTTDWVASAGTITSIAETATGVYTITGTSFINGITLRTALPSAAYLVSASAIRVMPIETMTPFAVVI